MVNQYRTKEWLTFRQQIFESDGWKCVDCGKESSTGKGLQVHHEIYVNGQKPWEAPAQHCRTLCKKCHAMQHGKIRPDYGWDFYCDEDLGDLSGECDRCGNDIRYVFHIGHPNWGMMEVGTDCCDELTGTREASSTRKAAQRLERFLHSKRWKIIDGLETIKQMGFEIRIIHDSEGYGISANGTEGAKRFLEVNEAKIHAFHTVDDGTMERFFKNRSTKK
ncbi:MAG: HNH endonuclease [Phreatobacter sp.]|uniref:HNH endonuclease n=1 Tax=Phreatobacter sp. TaxID=1966341 RepID=UPI001A54F051|nr:hypothetical protein [Phreatobacter sp.]MBL8571514.1 HNH endonuclease [Phreatobacter sp.]